MPGRSAPHGRQRSEKVSCPLIGMQPADDREPRRAGQGWRRLSRLDPVVDDLEALLVEALRARPGTGRAPRRSRCGGPRAPPTARSAARERPPVAERVEPVLRARRAPGRARAGRRRGHESRRGRGAYGGSSGRGLRTIRGAAGTRPGRRRARGAARSTGTPAASSRDAKLRGTGLVLVEHHEADVEAALAERREEQDRWFSEPEIPADLRDVEYANAHGPASVGP